jgi:molybdopterin/thiamine biosynthesis adenylyltransferase
MITVFLGIGFVALFFVGMSARLILLNKGEFKGTCASQNPFLNPEGAACGYCGKTGIAGDTCEKNESEVTKILEKFN